MHINKPVTRMADYPALALVFAFRALANIFIRCLRFFLYGKTPRQVEKIIVFRTGSLGDSICALPAIAQIRKNFPQAQLDILTNAGATNLVSMQKLLHPDAYHKIIDYFGSSVPELTRQIMENRYDLVIELPQYDSSFFRLVRNMVFFRLKTGIKKGFGWQLDNIRWFKKTQNRSIRFEDERSRLLGILNKYTRNQDKDLVFPLAINQADEMVVTGWMQQNNLNTSETIIAIVPGAKRPANTWPKEYMQQVAQHFSAKTQVVLCGGENEKELATSLKGDRQNVWNACGAFTPVQTAVFFGRCQLVITNDTGPLHLAYAAGTPTVSMFSNRDYAVRWSPPENSKNKTFRATGITCAPCFLEECPYNNKCLRAIEVAPVIAAAEEILETQVQKA
jgi:ADP-heptose:LPS heptosyltransferase